MAGYTRTNAADITAGATVRAAPINAELNALVSTFNNTSGHKHDGTTAEGPVIGLIGDPGVAAPINKVVIDNTNNRVGLFIDAGGAGFSVEQLRFQDGVILPVTTNDIDLGSSALQFKDLHIDGTANIDSLVADTADINGGTLDGVTIGGSSAGAVTTTSLVATTADINGGTLDGVTIGGSSAGAITTTSLVASTADINGGTLDGAAIGSASPSTGDFTNVSASGTVNLAGATVSNLGTVTTANIDGGSIDGVTVGTNSAVTDLRVDNLKLDANTLSSTNTNGNINVTPNGTGSVVIGAADINGGAIDGTVIGASTAAAGSFTTVSTSGQATLATADINGGTLDGAVIGGSSPGAITGTTITANTAFSGNLTGNVTGNVSGNITGDITGDVTGDLTGNVTASSGTTTLNNLIVNGTANFTSTLLTNVTDPTSAQDAATKNYVDTQLSGLVDSAPGALNTLNELAAAINDDANFSTTITNSIATKLPLAGGTMSGDIAMGSNKVTGLATPSSGTDAANKTYADTKLPLAGGTMSGAIAMGSNKITGLDTPTATADATTKGYVDGILGSATAAASSASAAASSQSAAASSATAASNSQSAAAASAASAATTYDLFDDRMLGAKSSAPTVDNDGDALALGSLYFDTTTNTMKVYGSGGWAAAGSSVNGTAQRFVYTVGTNSGTYTSGSTTVFPATYDAGYVDVFHNGVKLITGTDFTATNGTSITLASAAASGDAIDIIGYGTFSLASFSVNDASDVNTSGVSNGQVLAFNSTSGDFEPSTVDLTALSASNLTSGTIPDARFPATLPAISGANLTGIISDVVEDTSPQLGGALDVNGNSITSASNGNITVDPNGTGQINLSANVDVTGTVTADGLTVQGDGTISGGSRLTISDIADVNNDGIRLDDNTTSRFNNLTQDTSGNFKIQHWTGSAWQNNLTVTTGGSVGIGTSSPAHNMEIVATAAGSVNDSLQIRNNATSSGTGSRIRFINSTDNTSDTNGASISSVRNGDDNDLVFETENVARMTIDHAGSVGIGTATPAFSRTGGGLRIDNSDAPHIRLDNGSSNVSEIYQSGVNTVIDSRSPSGVIKFTVQDSEKMRLTGGRLGIATSNPLSALHVAGGVDASPAAAGFHAGMSGNYAAIEMAGSDGGFIDFQDATDGNDHAGRIIYAHSDDTMKFSTAGVQRLTITSNGNATFNGTVFAPNVSLYPNSSAPNADAAIFRPQDGHLGFVAAASERGRFAGGTFLVGKTSSGTTTAGFEAQSSGLTAIVRDSNTPLYVGRNSNDGDIVVLRKGSTTVASIGVMNGNNPYIANDADNSGLQFGSGSITPSFDGAGQHASVDMGSSSTSFKNYYGLQYMGAGGHTGYMQMTGSHDVRFVTNGSERARFSTGALRIGQASTDHPGSGNTTTGIGLRTNGDAFFSDADSDAIYGNRNNAGGVISIALSGTAKGGVAVASGGVTFNTTSDRRLKENIEPLKATDKLMEMNPVLFNWKADPDGPKNMGFIAQDMRNIMPEAVSTGDDDEAMMSMDYGRITPILVSALQDAHRKIEQLEQRIADMEAGNE